MITTHNLTKIYSSFRAGKTLAVDHIDFEVKPKDIFGFLGPNGAGKTTTIHMLTSVLEPTEGTAEICGYDILNDPLSAKRHMGFMPELPAFYDWMKGEDQLKFYSEFYGHSTGESRKRAKELMELVGLSEFRSRKIKTYSHGMRKRLALAQAMVNDPDLLILDEPMGGLDPMGLRAFREMIRELNKHDITIFLSSHLLSEVQQVCNRVGIIHSGRILAVDTITNLSKHIEFEPFTKLHIDGRMLPKVKVEIIKSVEGILEIKPGPEGEGGYVLHLKEGADAEKVGEELCRRLAEQKVYISRLELVRPNLEELFMKITRGK